MGKFHIRPATHAGSWYEEDDDVLNDELDAYMNNVPESIDGNSLPVAGARVIIAPHAGYTFSGPCAAWAYKALNLEGIKNILVFGPSHTYYLDSIAFSTAEHFEVPFGHLRVNTELMQQLKQRLSQAGVPVDDIPVRNDKEEHSLEMQMPYIHRRIHETHEDNSNLPSILPILVGDLSSEATETAGQVLSTVLSDPTTALVVSSDFCHWGTRFRYRRHCPDGTIKSLTDVGPRWKPGPGEKEIYEGIEVMDRACMDAISSGVTRNFESVLEVTDNTVCGRRPIALAMATLEHCAVTQKFKFVRYERSNLVDEPTSESVSYASAYAVL